MMMEDNNSHGTLRCGVTAACFIRHCDRSGGGAEHGERLRQRRPRGVGVVVLERKKPRHCAVNNGGRLIVDLERLGGLGGG
jgi:hypothetical protein